MTLDFITIMSRKYFTESVGKFPEKQLPYRTLTSLFLKL